MAIKEQNQDLNSDCLAPESTHFHYATVPEGERQSKREMGGPVTKLMSRGNGYLAFSMQKQQKK